MGSVFDSDGPFGGCEGRFYWAFRDCGQPLTIAQEEPVGRGQQMGKVTRPERAQGLLDRSI